METPTDELSQLMLSEELPMKKLEDLVQKSIEEEQLLSAKILEAEQDAELTRGQWLADLIASFGGSWNFTLLFFAVIVVLIGFNSWQKTPDSFDPYPYILLNLILSGLAALQAPVIMMSQNRQEDKDRRRSRSDYMVNLKAEVEVRNLQGKVDLLITDQMKSLFEIQRKQLDLLTQIQGQLAKQKD